MDNYYFVGIKGAGMSALACMLFDNGNKVAGCDYEEEYYTTEGLKQRKILIQTFEQAKIRRDHYVIVGNAFTDHELVKRLVKEDYMVYTYSRFLGKLSKEYYSVAITGAHGKTTTTNLCRQLMSTEEGVNYVVGDGIGAGDPLSDTFIFEACEYKRNFLNYFPNVAIVTNIDYDHPDYYKNIEDVCDAFKDFIGNSKFLIYNGDDLYLREISKSVQRKLSFGLNQENNFYATNIEHTDEFTEFDVYCNQKFFDRFKMPLFGNHNIYNALAAIAFSLYMGINKRAIKTGLLHYQKSKRRFEIFYAKDQIIMSDYAHHPTEIKATHDALRLKFKEKQLICVFEPHTFSRTKQFINQFKEALELYDKVFLKDIFTSVREHDETIKITDLCDRISDCEILTDQDLSRLEIFQDAVIVFMGAGNIDKTANSYYKSQISE